MPIVQDMLPTIHNAVLALSDLRARILAVRALTRDKASYDQLSDDTKSRLRWRPAILPLFQNLSSERAIALSGWWITLSKPLRDELSQFLHSVHFFEKQMEPKDERTFLGELGDIFKKYQDLISSNWLYYIDIHLLTDYLPVNLSALDKDVVNWVTGDLEHDIAGSTSTFYDYFRKGVKVFFQNCCGPEPDQISDDDFLRDPMNYARVGTSDGARLKMNAEGKVVLAKRSKWASFLNLNRSDLRRLLYGRTNYQHGKSFAKREKGKIRAVITADDETYLQMSFVSYWIEAKLKNHPNTPLFYNSRQMLNLFYRLARNGKVKNPIDQKEFDHRVTAIMIQIVLQEMRNYIKNTCTWKNKNNLIAVVSIIMRRLSGGTITLSDGKEVVITKGVLSGWRWTSLLNSIINASEVYAFSILMRDNNIPQPIDAFVSYGDDVATDFNDFGRAIIFNTMYSRTNFIVNPKKTFLSPIKPNDPTVDEFLRLICTRDQVLGYPARAAASLIYRNPTNPNPPPGNARIREMFDNWNLLISRNYPFQNNKVMSLAKDDICKANRIQPDMLDRILHTPACLGGAGLRPWTDAPLTVINNKPNIHWKYHKLPPLSYDHKHSATEVAELWLSNLQPTKKVKVEYSEYELVPVSNYSYNVYRACPINLDAAALTTLKYNKLISLSDQELYKRDINAAHTMKQVLDIAKVVIDPIDMGTVQSISKRCSLRVTKAWITDKLPRNVPVVIGWGSLPVSVVYNALFNSLLASRYMGRKITWAIILKIALTAELYTPNILGTLPRYTG